MEPTNLLDLAEMQSQLGQRLHSLALRSPASCQQECQSLLAGDGSDGGPGPGVVAYALTFSGLADIKLGHLERALQTLRRAQHEARAESLPGWSRWHTMVLGVACTAWATTRTRC